MNEDLKNKAKDFHRTCNEAKEGLWGLMLLCVLMAVGAVYLVI